MAPASFPACRLLAGRRVEAAPSVSAETDGAYAHDARGVRREQKPSWLYSAPSPLVDTQAAANRHRDWPPCRGHCQLPPPREAAFAGGDYNGGGHSRQANRRPCLAGRSTGCSPECRCKPENWRPLVDRWTCSSAGTRCPRRAPTACHQGRLVYLGGACEPRR